MLNLLDHVADLIDRLAVAARPGSPLIAVHRPQLALGVGPFVPDRDAMLVQIANVRLAAQEPQQLVDDRLEVQLLRRHQRKAVGQIEPHLVAEDAARAGAGAIALRRRLRRESAASGRGIVA